MKFRQALLWLCLLVCGAAMAQTGGSFRVKGVVLDSLTLEGEPYATVKIAKKNNPASWRPLSYTKRTGISLPSMYPVIYVVSLSRSELAVNNKYKATPRSTRSI